MNPTTFVSPLNDANRLGLAYRAEANRLPWTGPIWDVHTHITDLPSARLFLEVADLFGVERIWSMTDLELVDDFRAAFGRRIEFIAVPAYRNRHDPDTFRREWIRRVEAFAAKDVRICKFWAAPRGLDFSEDLRLDAPIRLEGMEIARSLGMDFMVHVADPDTWFASHYRDHRRYGRKDDHYVPLERLLDQFGDVRWIGAHMGGSPENLERLQRLLDRHPNFHLDTSATKWMVRELSRRPDEVRDFAYRNAGRILFGSDLVTNQANMDFDHYASRYWALRTFWETDYRGPSPIVDPDLSLLNPDLPAESTPMLHGARADPATLAALYRHAPEAFRYGPTDRPIGALAPTSAAASPTLTAAARA